MIPVRFLLETQQFQEGELLGKQKHLYRGHFEMAEGVRTWSYEEKVALGGGQVCWKQIQMENGSLWRMERSGQQPLLLEFAFPGVRTTFDYPTPYGVLTCWYEPLGLVCSGAESWQQEDLLIAERPELELQVQYVLGMGASEDDPMRICLRLQVRADRGS